VNADELNPKPAENLATAGDLTRSETRRATGGIPGNAQNHAGQTEAVSKRSSGSLAVLALLLAALALAAATWQWLQSGSGQQEQAAEWQTQQQQLQAELQRLEAALAQVQDSAQESARQQASSLTGDLQQRLQAVEAALQGDEDFRTETAAWNRSAQAALEDSQARINSMDERLRTLTSRSAESNSELELEEIDYLLRMAQERLQLFGDTRNADRALQLADQQVLAFDNPLFIALRREIAAARQALAAADMPDMVTLGAELDKLQDSLATLPFKSTQYAATVQSADAGAELSWWERLKGSLASLVTIRRIENAETALPALADQQALRQRAWLQLEQARLAALSREQDLYLDALKQAEATITRWFATDDAKAKLSLSALQALQQRNVNPPMPDISGPWTTLRSIRDAGLSPTAPVAAAAPSEAVVTEAEPEVNALPQAEANELPEDSPQLEPEANAVIPAEAESDQ